ncbi:hypothetical protein [Actinoplanes siamensis]|uniref:Uncharacterized protein n=1 Tax=Actinoplanes siamensis TaxID=1223317 RepID=A0A919NDG1_9ACTN|nr:hypothetical protein [Actinoplanes siamensis]GIF08720.1 hypothetical protein Asi03nite_62580 [Actinoplanes siamensis]
MARNTLPLEPPLPVVPPVGRCRFPELLVEVVPLKLWQHQVILPCFERATRRVKVGLHVDEPVCLWHSLVVQQRLGGHLVRDYART